MNRYNHAFGADKNGTKYTVEYWYNDHDTISYETYKSGFRQSRTAKVHYAAWVRRLHGNPPAGTFYWSFRAIFPDGTRATIPLYI